MRRITAGFLLLSLLAFTVLAHGDGSHSEKGPDVTVKTIKVSGNVYMLQGRGGNVGAITGPQGILIVDDDYKVVSEKLREALKDLGSSTPKFILNTHWHSDHTEGNEIFGKEGIVISHDNVRKRLMQTNTVFGQAVPPSPSIGWPIVTYADSITIHFDDEDIRAEHYPNGHTDGDSVIFFVKANVVHMGDDFFAGRFPFVDLDSGGSVQGMINNVTAIIAKIPADAKVIPGHGPLSTVEDLKLFQRTLTETAKIVQDEMKKKKTLEEIKKAGLPDKYKEFGSGFIKTDAWIETVYKSYAKK
jgi:cyclase